MIDRFQLIQNIGSFDSFAAPSGQYFSPFTFIYAENGRGKTTLSAILRSLATGDPTYINGRERFGSTYSPHVVVPINQGQSTAVFQNSNWSMTYPDILIFDDFFVHENVHSGLLVEPGHRQNLHELIIGRKGVSLARQVEELTKKIAGLQRTIREKEEQITPEFRGSLSIDQFCSLTKIPDIDTAIKDAERRVAALRESDAVGSTPIFESLTLPDIDTSSIEELLSRGLPELDAAAIAAVHEHLSSLGQSSEAWVSQGVRYLEKPGISDFCPFCGQEISASTLIDHYRVYFGQAYSDHKRNIDEAHSALVQDLGGDSLANFQRQLEVARERHRFWRRFIELPNLDLDSERIAQSWQDARDVVISCLGQKTASPLECIVLDDGARSKLAGYTTIAEEVISVGQALQDRNTDINRLKTEAQEGDLSAAKVDLGCLMATKSRFSNEVQQLCSDYLAVKEDKELAEQQKASARKRLDQHREEVIPRYQTGINELLRKFNADFRIVEVQAVNPRGRPSSTYCLEINNHRVPVDGSEPPSGSPAFQNTLSSGDRNTLALAFFFAWLSQEPNLSSVVVVIDDPVSSLDDARIVATAQEIRELEGRTMQTIVLSHSKQLLCAIWQHADHSRCTALVVRRSPSGSTITSWDIHEETITEYDRRHALLRDYDRGTSSDARQVAQSLRPVLEGFLRVACPEYYVPGTHLGTFVERARQSLNDPSPILSTQDLTELEQIKEYANRFHHDTNPAWDTEVANINETQLRGFMQRVLAFACRG